MTNILKEHYKKMGRKGGNSTFKKLGREHFSKIAKKMWKNKRKRVFVEDVDKLIDSK